MDTDDLLGQAEQNTGNSDSGSENGSLWAEWVFLKYNITMDNTTPYETNVTYLRIFFILLLEIRNLH